MVLTLLVVIFDIKKNPVCVYLRVGVSVELIVLRLE